MGILGKIFGKDSAKNRKKELSQKAQLKEYRLWDAKVAPSAALASARMLKALENRHWDIVEYQSARGVALERSVKVRTTRAMVREIESKGSVYLKTCGDGVILLMPVLAIPVIDDDPERIRWLAAKGADVNEPGNIYQNYGISALHIAIILHRNEAVRALLDCGADPCQPLEEYPSETPLRFAERAGNLEAAVMLHEAIVAAQGPAQNTAAAQAPAQSPAAAPGIKLLRPLKLRKNADF